jgi:hypothetical protein
MRTSVCGTLVDATEHSQASQPTFRPACPTPCCDLLKFTSEDQDYYVSASENICTRLIPAVM